MQFSNACGRHDCFGKLLAPSLQVIPAVEEGVASMNCWSGPGWAIKAGVQSADGLTCCTIAPLWSAMNDPP
jgi:hypothetical protein